MMSKYDFEVDLDIRSSTGMILSKIKPNSIVLEFGCASGRMTKYLKNALNCQVYIVEYDKEAFDVAVQYAYDGVCDDILSLSWMDKFHDVKYDAILFVDVLEHLIQPNIALSKAVEFLKDSGQIYISIPNIAHNDIILKMLANHFDYMNLGILDDTHVHFWGYENIIPFANKNGLIVNSIEATYCATGTTEQRRDKNLKISPILLNYLNERKYAEAYQFIVVLEKQLLEGRNKDIAADDRKGSYITSHLYIDNGNDFNEENIIAFQSENIASGRYIAHYVLNDIDGIKRLRFDPVELQGCIMQNFSARQAGRQLKFIYSDHLEITDGILMLGTDPMILIDIPSEITTEAITIDADFVILSDKYLDILQENCIFKQSEFNTLRIEMDGLDNQIGNLITQNEELNKNVDNLNTQKEELNAEVENLRIQNERLSGAVNTLNTQNDKLNVEIRDLNTQNERLNVEISSLTLQNEKLNVEASSLNAQNEKLNIELGNFNTQNTRIQSDIDAYILLVNKKDELLILKDRLLKEKDSAIEERDLVIGKRDSAIKEKDSAIKEKEEFIKKLEERVEYFENRRCIKVCNKFWKVYWRIILAFRKLVGKKDKDE